MIVPSHSAEIWQQLDAYWKQAEEAMLFDAAWTRKRLRAIRFGDVDANAVNAELKRIESRLRQSIAKRIRRVSSAPSVTLQPDLPVTEHAAEISRAIKEHQVIVVAGDTGSGKSTQLPLICLQLGRGAAGMIAHTQPRRIAARSIASRLASQLQQSVGRDVGFKVRFTDTASDATRIKVMTDGVLLNETRSDRYFDRYDTIILDEAHERSLNIDFLLGYIKRILPRRPDLRVIITSATIDTERFANHFAPNDTPAPVISVQGRTYPVEVRYRPVEQLPQVDADDTPVRAPDRPVEDVVVDAAHELARDTTGDLLVFLPGEREIRDAAEALRKRGPKPFDLLPLYSRLTAQQQDEVFADHKRRRIVLATNVAETSLTVPNIHGVIDTGTARISRYSTRRRLQRLPVEAVSQASANQRKGRCGRVAPGICIRLYDEDDFNKRPEFTQPEILRTNLAGAVLQMKSLRLGEIAQFPFVERPDDRLIRDAEDTLRELNAIDDHNNLTQIGKELSHLPVDPRIGRMLLEAAAEHVLPEMLVIASFLSVQDPRERPFDKREEADLLHARFNDEASDFVTVLNLWSHWKKLQDQLGSSALKRGVKQQYLSHARLREWNDVYKQLREMLKELGYSDSTRTTRRAGRSDRSPEPRLASQLRESSRRPSPAEPDMYAAIHRSILSGMLVSIGKLADRREYQGTHGTRFEVHPSSPLSQIRPQWIVAAEVVHTTKHYARVVARVQPKWIERVAHHLVQRTYTDPIWSVERQRVHANEKVSLFGLELITDRPVHYGPINPDASRELFIHHGLVDESAEVGGDFLKKNRKLIDEIEHMEAKQRKRDLLVDSITRFDFYNARIPKGVHNTELFETWRIQTERRRPTILHMTMEDLLRGDAQLPAEELYPSTIRVPAGELPVDYAMEPQSDADGLTLTVPIEAMNQIDEDQCEWLVPGLIREKIIELVRRLPKQYRRHFGPAPAFADAALAELKFGDGSLTKALSRLVARANGITIPPTVWRRVELPAHLRMTYRIIDRDGSELGTSSDLTTLKQTLAPTLSRRLRTSIDSELTREQIVSWDFGDLPEHADLQRAGVSVRAWCALADAGSSAAIRLFDSESTARSHMRLGLRRLLMLAARRELKALVDAAPEMNALRLMYSTIGPAAELRDELVTMTADLAFLQTVDPWTIRTKADFESLLQKGLPQIHTTVGRAITVAKDLLSKRQAVLTAIDAPQPDAWNRVADDIRSHVELLTPQRFLSTTPSSRYANLSRTLSADLQRWEKLARNGVAKDAVLASELKPYTDVLDAIMAAEHTEGHQTMFDDQLDTYKWLIEDLRVSLFAPTFTPRGAGGRKRIDELRSIIMARLPGSMLDTLAQRTSAR